MPTNMNVLMLSSVINQRYTRLHGTADTMLTLWHVGVSSLLLVVVVCVCPLLASCILSPSIPYPAGYPNLYPVPLYPLSGAHWRAPSAHCFWRAPLAHCLSWRAPSAHCLSWRAPSAHALPLGGRLRRTARHPRPGGRLRRSENR
jgi:hypothetical protein